VEPWLRCVAAALGGLGALACDGPPRGVPRDVLVVTLDTTRADHLGCYGYFRDTSPEIDALARESILFENALAPMATTLPTHVSVFTGTSPHEHGVLANSTQSGRGFVASPALRPIAAIAAERGYRTAAFISAAPLKRGSGIELGFETFDEAEGKQRPAAATVDAAIRWLSQADATPFFLWIHFYDAHWPYAAPPSYAGLFQTDPALERYLATRRVADRTPRPLVGTIDEARPTINAYDAELRYQDAEFGRLGRWLVEHGRWDGTAILLLGDHGEGLGQHGEAGHGSTWREQIHAPLLMRVPGAAPRRISAPVSLVDALPTFLGLLRAPGLALPANQASGRDALAAGPGDEPILSQATGRDPAAPRSYALTTGRWKYFRREALDGVARDSLYDLEADPFELEDVSTSHPDRVSGLRGALERRVRGQLDRGEELRGGRPPETRSLDPELRRQLEALGYSAGAER